jgi:TolB-like protein/Flp pilus assembly protein TadD
VPPSASAGAGAARTVLPNSVAVLPFANLSPNRDDAYFAAGIHEEILNYLAKLKSLSVIGRTSMMRYAETDKSIPEIATELSVATVMEGSVRYADGRVRVTTQLNDGITGAHLWSEAYERDFKDIFAIQADIAMSVANALSAEFSPEEQQRIEAVPNVSTDTYAAYLRVVPALSSAGNQGPQIVAALDQMIAEAPDFAAPYGWKGFVLANLLINTTFGSARERSETQTLARTSAERALALDPNDAQAHSALAVIEMVNWLWPEVRQRYARSSWAPGGLASLYGIWFLSWTERRAEAVDAAQRATELGPFDPGAYWYLGMALSYGKDYDGAVTAFERAIDLVATPPLFHTWLAYAEIGRGDRGAALRELQLAEQLLGPNRAVIYLLDMLYAYGRIGRTEDAQRLFAELQRIAANQDIGTGGWAQAYLAVGDQQKALEQLRAGAERARNKVLDPGFFQLMNIRMNATADPVLEQPEFAAVRAALSGD